MIPNAANVISSALMKALFIILTVSYSSTNNLSKVITVSKDHFLEIFHIHHHLNSTWCTLALCSIYMHKYKYVYNIFGCHFDFFVGEEDGRKTQSLLKK